MLLLFSAIAPNRFSYIFVFWYNNVFPSFENQILMIW